MKNIIVRKLMKGEEKDICELIEPIFMNHIAPDYSNKGIKFFLNFIKPSNIKRHLNKNYIVLVAENKITHRIIRNFLICLRIMLISCILLNLPFLLL